MVTAIPISIDRTGDAAGPQPLTFGLPFPVGLLGDHQRVHLSSSEPGIALPLQTRPLAHWPDRSVRWLLIDTILPSGTATNARYRLDIDYPQPRERAADMVRASASELHIDTGAARFTLPGSDGMTLDDIRIDAATSARAGIVLLDRRGRAHSPTISQLEIEERGNVRTSVSIGGNFAGTRFCFRARFSFFRDTALTRLQLTLANPQRARHRRGVWDLGDRGSLLFRDLSLVVQPRQTASAIHWSEAPGEPQRRCADSLQIYQDSSGGPNWHSATHHNARGSVPLQFRGYRVRADAVDSAGHRADPVVGLTFPGGGMAIAAEEFWQNFPTAIEADRDSLRLRLFPEQFAEPFELQGGEQKTHTVWLDFDTDWETRPPPLRSATCAATARTEARWYASSGVDKALAVASCHPVLREILDSAASGPTSLTARRELIDEYGWRNFGDLFADHEGRFYTGTPPVISHYNNQYDVIYGCLLQFLWSGNSAWRGVADPLARHVMDVDLYNTREDRPAYNGGLFWHTDHYVDAATASHRSYSAANRPSFLASYGGGPGAEHNYTSGLLLYHYLTGEPRAREAVIQLADWVIDMDDGEQTILGLIDSGPTGLATRTTDNRYQGPGRGAGNSLNALLDGWLVTEQPRYLDKAQEIIHRVVHPEDDIERHQLHDIERRWSYVMFLRSLHRYLELKEQHDELDEDYDYAGESLLHYGRWMLRHESAYFDRVEQLEYPTEAWPTLDILKANVLRAAACRAEPSEHMQLRAKADEIADQAWSLLASPEMLDTRGSARALAHLTQEGLRDRYWRGATGVTGTAPVSTYRPGPRPAFAPQRQRVLRDLRTPTAWPRIARRLLDPRVWRRVRLGRP